MVKLYHSSIRDDFICPINYYFNRRCEISWFEHPLVEKIVMSIDKTKQVRAVLFDSPIFKAMGPERLSGAAKTLIMALAQPENFYSASAFGDNCGEAIEMVSKEIDLQLIYENYLPLFSDDTEIMVIRTCKVVKGRDFFGRLGEYL